MVLSLSPLKRQIRFGISEKGTLCSVIVRQPDSMKSCFKRAARSWPSKGISVALATMIDFSTGENRSFCAVQAANTITMKKARRMVSKILSGS